MLDRPTRKRCELLVVQKPRRDGSGSHEQVFFRTAAGIRAHRSHTHLELAAPAHLARVLAELAALHPTLPVVYAGNRKLANLWTARFFAAVAARRADAAPGPDGSGVGPFRAIRHDPEAEPHVTLAGSGDLDRW